MEKLSAIANVLHADVSLATTVKYSRVILRPWVGDLIHIPRRFLTVHLAWSWSAVPPFIKCLESLPNLHTLELRRVEYSITTPLKGALKGVKLPQIKALIIPPTVHPLLQHCPDVEDVVCVITDETLPCDGFLRSLTSKRGSKIKRLSVPFLSLPNPSSKWFSTP